MLQSNYPGVVGAASVHADMSGALLSEDENVFPKGLVVKRRQIGLWNLLAATQPVVMTAAELDDLESIIDHWRETFAGGVEKTLIQKKFGVHSAIIRLDYFWKPNFGVQLCEVEERPAGLFASSLLNKQFRDPLMHILGGVEYAFGKPLAFCVSNGRSEDSDDQDLVRLFRWGKGSEGGFEPNNIPFYKGVPPQEVVDRHVWWVRALRDEKEYFALEPHALTTISQEGDKEYGLRMGRWFEIADNWRHILPLEQGVVLKPKFGSRFEHALIIQTARRSSGARKDKLDGGVHGEKKAREAIESGSVAYWQPFYPPEEPKFLGDSGYRMMRRAYFGFDFVLEKYVPMGGMWFAHNSSRIHGGSDALVGPLYLPL